MAASILNSLPQEIHPPLVSDILLADHRDYICLIRHFRKVGGRIATPSHHHHVLPSQKKAAVLTIRKALLPQLQAAEANDTLLMERLTGAIALVIRLHSQAEMDVLCEWKVFFF